MFPKQLSPKATQHNQQMASGLMTSDLDIHIRAHYGVPSTASILAVDRIQRLMAIGTLDGRIKVIGGENIEGLLISPKQLPYKYLEFLQNEGFLISITNENDIQVWNLESRSVACNLLWESNITAFSVINGSHFMYVGDECGTVSVLKYSVVNGELLQLPYHISWSSLSGGFPHSDHQPVVGVLPQPCTSGNRLLIAYESGLIILWDVIEAQIIYLKGDKGLHLKDGAIDLPDKSLQQNLEEKEISTLCWAANDGSVLAAGYIDGDILFWKTTNSTGQDQQLDNVVKLQLSSAEKRLPVIVLHWWANRKSRNKCDGQLLIYGGDEVGSDEVVTVLTLEWSSGMEIVNCLGRVDITLSSSFADMILLPAVGETEINDNGVLFILTSPAQLKVFDCSSLSALVYKDEKKTSPSAYEVPVELLKVDPSITVTKLSQLREPLSRVLHRHFESIPPLPPPKPSILSSLSMCLILRDFFIFFLFLNQTTFVKTHSTTLGGPRKWPLTGGVLNHISLAEVNRIQRLYIAGYRDGSVQMWDATYPVLSLLCVFGSEVNGVNTAISSASVSSIDLCLQTLRLAIGDECGLVCLYDFNQSDEEKFQYIDETKREVHGLTKGQGPSCRAVINLVNSRVKALEFINHGAKLAVGYENAKVAVLDMMSLSVLFLTDSVSGGSSPLVSLLTKTFLHINGYTKSPKPSEPLETHMEELMFVLTKDAKIYVIDAGTGKNVSSRPLHLKQESTAISMYVIEDINNSSVLQPETRNNHAAGNEPSHDLSTSYRNDTEHHSESFLLLCCEDAMHVYDSKSVVHGEGKCVRELKLDKPCCWATTVTKDGKVLGLVSLFKTGEIEIRSLPDLELVEQTCLMLILRWNFKANMDRTMCSDENGHVILVNGCELVFLSLLAGENEFRIPASLPSLHDEVLAAAADAAINSSNQNRKQGGVPNILGSIVKGFKVGKPDHNMDLSQMSKSNFSHLEPVFMRSPIQKPSPSTSKEVHKEAELDIDDIEIDDHVPLVSTSKTHYSQRGETEREKLLDYDGNDPKPRPRTREEIIAKYRKPEDPSSAAGEARDKLLERQEKLERINKRTEELRSGAENFSSMANELVKAMENKKWWQI